MNFSDTKRFFVYDQTAPKLQNCQKRSDQQVQFVKSYKNIGNKKDLFFNPLMRMKYHHYPHQLWEVGNIHRKS